MKGWAIWITGLPSSGKSTIARALAERLAGLGIRCQILESDELRRVITPNPTYSQGERDLFYGIMAYIGKLLSDNGANVIFDATANKRAYRDRARREIGKFMEVYVKCPLKVCMERDAKGIYRMGVEGSASNVPGLQADYEEPIEPDVVVESDKMDPGACAGAILEAMIAKFGLAPKGPGGTGCR
ncbi:MAG: adenylyl-sulfate kinase [Candidatus Bathyarchaeia archaeon]